MSHRRLAIISGALAAASFFSIGTDVAAQAASPNQYPTAKSMTSATPHGLSANATTQTTVRTATTRVGGTTEKILVDASGLPLYYFRADTAKHSNVSGGLAQLWPPLLSSKPSASGVVGPFAASAQPPSPTAAIASAVTPSEVRKRCTMDVPWENRDSSH